MSPENAHVLLVDDEIETLRALVQGLQEEGLECSTARNAKQALQQLERGRSADVVVTDLRLPGMSGVELAASVKRRWPAVEVVLLTAYPTSDSALESGRLGAADYLSKPIAPADLAEVIREVLERRRSSPASAAGLPASAEPKGFEGLIGRHPLMQELKRNIAKLGKLPAPVLILGESGTGKELVARALHHSSPRREAPFLAVNCGAIPRQLLESELFGHRKGAFTGADSDRDGFFVSAGKGTLFLDEIAELDLDLQVKLLRSLQEKEVTPLGGNRTVKWHARLVCATNVDIDRAVAERRFREDLYYRINVLRLQVPPLRERRSDIRLLTEWFTGRYGGAGGRSRRFSAEALAALQGRDWPGNVRQLENAVIQAVALAQGDELRLEDLPEPAGEVARAVPAREFPTYDEVVREHIVRALRLSGGVKTVAARYLRLDRNRLARMIRRYGIDVARIAERGASDVESRQWYLPRHGPGLQ